MFYVLGALLTLWPPVNPVFLALPFLSLSQVVAWYVFVGFRLPHLAWDVAGTGEMR